MLIFAIMKRIIAFITLALAICACKDGWTSKEKAIINGDGETLHVYTVTDPAENALLHEQCKELTDEMIVSDEYAVLTRKMTETLKDPEVGGVGIAGPQVGLSRRVIVLMRYDKPGIPYEAFPNIRITGFNGETSNSSEGCLSVPDTRMELQRYRDIDVRYTDPKTLRDTTEHITGFTAVIFQHECDHLDGILFTEKQ